MWLTQFALHLINSVIHLKVNEQKVYTVVPEGPFPAPVCVAHFYVFIALIWNPYLSSLTPVMSVFTVTPKLESQLYELKDFFYFVHHSTNAWNFASAQCLLNAQLNPERAA